jgi:50S ribosomal protein L16 3-hydroxylase
MSKVSSVLGDIAAQTFMREHWHKRLRLISNAIPDFQELLTPAEAMQLAQRDDVESRLIIRNGKTWSLEHGPFKASRWKSLPARDWTLLVQGLNLHLPAADQLLRRFNFLPFARLDDVMISVAVPGGGVGPHFDSYDVFLLQGIGVRQWRLSEQTKLELDPNAPLKILKNFKPEQTHDLVSGDMLYLPPHVAHDGVAAQSEGFCTTYSIGFRAPTRQEIVESFTHWLAETTEVEGRFADPDLTATSTPAELPKSYVKQIVEAISELAFDRDAIAEFAGCFATDPKPSVIFSPPPDPMSRAQFAKQALSNGVRLDAGTLCSYDATRLYVNGEAFVLMGDAAFWHDFANARTASVSKSLAKETIDALYDWYDEGWLHININE